ncbi:uncharacterized protein CTRU02_207197 [Colletotrichum truncatum]|uniref:Uncharacterized protein n=1 Tax=Colletotrichum truncatum TaxID=5467 RepID=A0ACC3Z051_COLTU|nr:uncharacterized protein CTRU02_01172 [Colletotrichum truncatum]KAF6800767.1 hypothetical protein CTRU02_01172 [Colletotrichum truncatum]
MGRTARLYPTHLCLWSILRSNIVIYSKHFLGVHLAARIVKTATNHDALNCFSCHQLGDCLQSSFHSLLREVDHRCRRPGGI